MDTVVKPAPICIPFAGSVGELLARRVGRWIITVKRDLVPQDTIYSFADPRFIGRTFVMTEETIVPRGGLQGAWFAEHR